MRERERVACHEWRHVERCCGRHGVPTIWAFVCGVLLQRTYILKRAVRLGVACAVFRVLLGRLKKGGKRRGKGGKGGG